jgi:hypothetical protein
MVNTILVQLLVLFLSLSLHAKVDRVHSESYLGEKNLGSYSERYQPLIFQDIYQGKVSFEDELFFQNFFQPYLFQKEGDYSFFLRSELNGGMNCSNELLSEHFDDIRFSYRLITLSYLLESQWHMKLISDHFRLKNGCNFDLKSWVKSCKPKSVEMNKFVDRLDKYMPRYEESMSPLYKKEEWLKELRKQDYKWYSHYRVNQECKGNCSEETLPNNFKNICENDQKVMSLICSEMDEVYGLSMNRDAYYLLGLSNIINTYNKRGEAMGCLRRFSEVMAHKEVRFDVLNQLFPSLQTFLRQKYQERFLQGRVFFFGSGKEFEEKGLQDLYVKDQPLKIEKVADEVKVTKVEAPKKEEVKAETKAAEVAVAEDKKESMREIRNAIKSAFLQAAEIRAQSDLDRVEVDMMKLKYDYVFSLNMINTLSERLKTFMTREALAEMMAYDKLGTKEGPVPLLFLKYMIDMQEHHGLWNIISVLGDKFYVSNEIDASFTPDAQLVQLVNNASTGNQWQFFILKP